MNKTHLSLSFIFYLFFQNCGFAQNYSDQIRVSLEKSTQERPHSLAGIPVRNLEEVYQFFAQRNFDPTWSKEGFLTERAYELRFEIRQAQFDGLNPERYHLSFFESFLDEADRIKKTGEKLGVLELSEAEIIFTDAFFELASDLERGKINPNVLKATWSIPRRSSQVVYGNLLTAAIENADLKSGLAKLYPKTPMYQKGKQVMRELVEKSKTEVISWKPFKTDKSFKLGESNPIIYQLRERLAFWGYSSKAISDDPKKYDYSQNSDRNTVWRWGWWGW
jgi:murein L,D-transpeptidase YcbB/YkuD